MASPSQQHHPKPENDHKRNKKIQKQNFFMSSNGCSMRKTKMESKEGRRDVYHPMAHTNNMKGR